MPLYSRSTEKTLQRVSLFLLAPLICRGAHILLISVTYGLLGCFSTTLPPLDAPPELARLERLASTPVTLHVEVSDELASSLVGLQYVLGFIPVTRVYAPELARTVTNLVRLEAGLRGIACTMPGDTTHDSPRRSSPTLTVVVDDLSVNGYDLLVLRRPSAAITLTGCITRPQRGVAVSEGLQQRTQQCIQQCSAHADESFTSSYAFEAELNEALRRAIIRAAGMVLECLGKPRA